MDNRLDNEIKHGKFLAENGAEKIWNWASPAGKKRWERRVKMLTEMITPEKKVLELGCGTGDFTKEIVKTNAQITSIDISSHLLLIARKEVQAANVLFLEENAYQMSFGDNSFDFVVGSSVLHHLDIQKAISEIYRVLSPGGMIAFTEPNMLNPQIAVQKNIPYVKKKLGDSPDETAFFKWQLSRILQEAGFSNITVQPFDFLHPAVPEFMIGFVSRIGMAMEKCPIIKEIAGSLYIKALK